MAVAKYVALADELRKEILSGRYGTEGGLPSVKDIAEKSDFAINTVKNALSHLLGEGIIVKRGIGYYVNNITITMTQYSPPSHQRYVSGFNRNMGTVEKTLLPEHLAAKLHTTQQVVIFRAQIAGEIVEGNEHPLQISQRYYFLPLSAEKIQRMRDDPTFDPMWADVPINLVSHDEVRPRPATQEELKLLSIPTATSVLCLLEVIRDTSGTILMAQEIMLSPRIALVFDFPFENKPLAA